MPHQNKRIIASTIYRSPNSIFDSFHSSVDSKFPLGEYSTSEHVICGDFNLNLLNIHELQNDASNIYYDVQIKILLHTLSQITCIASSSRTLIFCSFKSGAPQDSNLDPLLFPIFINDFPKCSLLIKFPFLQLTVI